MLRRDCSPRLTNQTIQNSIHKTIQQRCPFPNPRLALPQALQARWRPFVPSARLQHPHRTIQSHMPCVNALPIPPFHLYPTLHELSRCLLPIPGLALTPAPCNSTCFSSREEGCSLQGCQEGKQS